MLIQIDDFVPMDHIQERGHGFRKRCKDIDYLSHAVAQGTIRVAIGMSLRVKNQSDQNPIKYI